MFETESVDWGMLHEGECFIDDVVNISWTALVNIKGFVTRPYCLTDRKELNISFETPFTSVLFSTCLYLYIGLPSSKRNGQLIPLFRDHAISVFTDGSITKTRTGSLNILWLSLSVCRKYAHIVTGPNKLQIKVKRVKRVKKRLQSTSVEYQGLFGRIFCKLRPCIIREIILLELIKQRRISEIIWLYILQIQTLYYPGNDSGEAH